MEIPTVGYQGFRSQYRVPSTVIEHRKDPFFNINPLKPRLPPNNVAQTESFKNATSGF